MFRGPFFHPKMPDRCFLRGGKDHRHGQCPHKAGPKPKGDKCFEQRFPKSHRRSRGEASSNNNLNVWYHDYALFDSGTTHVSYGLKTRQEERLAGFDDGELCAPGVGRLLPNGRTCRTLGLRFLWGGGGPYLVAQGTAGMYSVVWAHDREGPPAPT